MKRRTRSLGSRLFTLCAAAWVAVAPTIPTLHQAFAGHRHVYCLEHHRIEDAGPRQEACGSSPGGLTDPEIHFLRPDAAGVDSRPACPFSNLWRYAPVTVPALTSASAPILTLEFTRAAREVRRVVEILPFAPKHSPPLPA
jgi:hypothetical protein